MQSRQNLNALKKGTITRDFLIEHRNSIQTLTQCNALTGKQIFAYAIYHRHKSHINTGTDKRPKL